MMFRKIVLCAALALAAARPEPNMFEEEITAELRKYLEPLDPKTIESVDNWNITTHDDTSLIFNFKDASLSDFSNIECTHFTPPILTKEVTLSLKIPKVTNHATSYTTDGILNGHPFSAEGAADLGINTPEITVKFHATSYSMEPASLCIEAGTLEVDLSVDSLEANFDNADELNQELNDHGPELVERLQADIMEQADAIVELLNNALCHE